MAVQYRTWNEIVNVKTRRTTGIAVLRWTLLRHVTRSLDQLPNDESKKEALSQEMTWLNQYWAQAIPKSSISPKYWQRLLTTSSLQTRRDLYE
jgi:hypothetical protein